MPITLEQLDLNEVLRYMGCPPEKADEDLRTLIGACAGQLLAAVRPRWTYRIFDVTLEEEGVRLSGGLLLPGEDLKRHLAGCRRAAVFCATLSAQADALIRRAESGDMLRALALDCCATAAVEQVCDQAEQELQAMFPGCYFPFRFSPGYGDLPITLQNSILTLLDAPRKIGLCASASHILTPRKSVTAILGVADQPVAQTQRSCISCPAHDSCQYRKSGGHCGIS